MNSRRGFTAFAIFLLALQFFCAMAGAADVVQVESGKAITGTIKAGETQHFSFNAEKGTSFILTLRETGPHVEGFLPGLELKDPTGQLIDGGSRAHFYRVSMNNVPASGTWSLDVNRSDTNDKGGSYELSLLQVPGIKGKTAKVGKLYRGIIDQGTVDVYTVRGYAHYTARAVMTAAPGTKQPIEMWIVSPKGVLVGNGASNKQEERDMFLPEDGDYTVFIYARTETDEKLAYSLAVTWPGEVPPSYAEETSAALEPGKPVTGTIRARETKRYAFTTEQGKNYIASVSMTGKHNDNFRTFLQITGARTQIDMVNQPTYARARMMLPPAGKWMAEVSVMDDTDAQNGYQLQLLELPGATGKTMKFGQGYSGTLPPGGIDVYTFNGTPGLVGNLSLVPEIKPRQSFQVLMIGPDGAMVQDFGGTDRMGAPAEMKLPGIYTIVVMRDEDVGDTGSYSIFMTRPGAAEPKTKIVEAAQQQWQEMLDENAINNVFRSRPPDKWPMPARYAQVYGGGIPVYRPAPNHFSKGGRFTPITEPTAQLRDGDKDFWGAENASMKMWKKSAAQGNIDARNRIGAVESANNRKSDYAVAPWYARIVAEGRANGGDKVYFSDKREMAQKPADQNIAVAQYNLAAIYMLGIDGDVDTAQAAKWYAKAAAQGLTVAQNDLGQLHEQGDGVAQSDAEAAALYAKAAEKGYPPAQYNLARLYVAGRGVKKDVAAAEKLLAAAAASEYTNAQAELDALQGRLPAALAAWRKLARTGDKIALQRLIDSYRKTGVPEADHDEVLAIYRIWAEAIDPVAFVALGDFFAHLSPPDNAEAYHWYLLVNDTLKDAVMPSPAKKALAEYATAEAARTLKTLTPEQAALAQWRVTFRHDFTPDEKQRAAAQMYMDGNAAWKAGDSTSGVIYWLRAATAGASKGWYDLGNIFLNGLGGMVRDTAKGIAYHRKAIIGGRAGSSTEIGDLYLMGMGVEANLAEAVKWYELDAGLGYGDAIDRLGYIYLYVMKDSALKARAMYEKAAALGVFKAYQALGAMYLYGVGVPKNPQEALRWYLKSEYKGHPEGAIQAALILKDYPPQDNALALKMLTSFGDPVAQNNAGFMYEHNLGVAEHEKAGATPTTALDFYKAAAAQCYGRAMFNIGRLLETGATAPKTANPPLVADAAAARAWMIRAVRHGSAAAALWLNAHPPGAAPLKADLPESELTFTVEPCAKEGQPQ